MQAQDFSQIVVPISSLGIRPSFKIEIPEPLLDLNANFGTGFCLDPRCSFIVTNYHVAALVRPHTIARERILRRYLATGPQDEGATANRVAGSVLAYAVSRDLAIFELRHAVHHHHGPCFGADELQPGQEVDIYGFPTAGAFRPSRKLSQFRATFKEWTTSGLLAFDFQDYAGPIRVRGASGGIVVDRKTGKIVGILNGISPDARGAVAVSVATLVEFVTKIQPFLAQKLFPTSAIKEVSPSSTDLYPKYVPLRSTDGLQHRPEEPYQVGVLRQKAQLLADSIRNFIAVQSYAWGSGDKDPDAQAAYEVRVIEGAQRFRSYPDGKEESADIPSPPRSAWVLPADEWSKLPKLVGTEYRLKINQAPEIVVNEQRIKVFQYYASVEDNLCPFEPVEDFGFFTKSKPVAVACYGEVWTDENMNIIRISERLDLSEKLRAYRGWNDVGVVLTYGWLKQDNGPLLVPLTILTQARDHKQIHWCRGHFTAYRVFSVRSRLITEEARPMQ